MRHLNLIGHVYGKLTVIYRAEDYIFPSGRKTPRWVCKCECGNEITLLGMTLRSGGAKSCGCLRIESAIINGKANATHGMTKTRLYNIWNGMKQRCYNPRCKDYQEYGSRGIRICLEWASDFKAFGDWAMENGYSEKLSIDRIDNNGNYEPSNCRWANAKEQDTNKRNNRIIEFNGKTQTCAEWCKELGIPNSTMFNRLKRGWSIERAFTTPNQE